MANATSAQLVAVEGLDTFDVQRALPDDPAFELVGADGRRRRDRADAADRGRRRPPRRLPGPRGRPVAPDHRQRPSRRPELPIIVLSTASPNGFLRRAFEAGAADMALFPQTKDQIRFAMSKAIARAPRRGYGERRARRRAARLRARPEGRNRQDADVRATSPSRSPRPGRRCWSSTSTSSSATSRSAWASAREDDLRPRALGRLARRGQARATT